MNKWQFDTIRSGQTQGWYSGGLTAFRDRQLRNLVREILQNSLDNPAGKDQREPVIVEFQKISLQRSAIPGMEDLTDHLTACEKAARDAAPHHLEEIRQARKESQSSTLDVLQISDQFTSGMSGGADSVCSENSPFFNYIKTEGESGGDQTRGGSHGLGKNAPLVQSQVRTIFACTRFKEKGTLKTLLQGRCQLRTRKNASGELLAATGYGGDKDFQPLQQVPEEFNWLDRSEQGTTISVIGWIGEKNWDQLIIAYAITNFFAAFKRDKLILTVGKHTVSAENLMSFLDNKALKDKFIQHDKSGNNEDEWELAKWFVNCLDQDEDEEKGIFNNDFQGAGKIGSGKLTLCVAEGAPQKVAFIRSNILITSYIPGFYKRVPGSLSDFVGIYECRNETGSSLLRKMEPPQHDKLDPDFLPFQDRQQGGRDLENLGKKLKDLVAKHAEIDPTSTHADDFTLEFFADDAGDSGQVEDDEDINPEGGLVIHIKPKQMPPPRPIQTEDDLDHGDQPEDDNPGEGEEGGAGEGSGGGGSGGGHGPGYGSGTGGTGNKDLLRQSINQALSISGERFIRQDSKGGQGKCFVPGNTGRRVEVILLEVGADALSMIAAGDISSCSEELGQKGIIVEVSKDGSVSFDFSLSRDLLGGLKILVNEVST